MKTRSVGSAGQTPVRLVLLALFVVALAGLTACSSDSPSGGGGKKVTVATTPPASGCGSFQAKAPADPNGVVKAIDNETYTKGIAGYPSPIRKSTWANWKPKGKPPYTVGVVWNQLTAPFQISSTNGVRARLKASGQVGKVLFSSTGTNLDVGQELQQMNALLRKKPDIIILEPLTAAAFAKQFKQAAAAGIPVLLALDSYDSPDVVNVGGNNVLAALQVNSVLVREMREKGNLLWAHGIPGSGPENDTAVAVKEILSNCPNIKKVGDPYGLFIPSTAKSETLKFLGTHPAKIDGVTQTATMASGVMQAFQQSGRPIPPTTDVGGTKGSLGYWRQHKDSYSGIATGLGGISYGTGLANVALRMLDGQGLQTNAVIQQLPLITDANLDEWSEPGWDLNTPGTGEAPPNAFATDAFLDPLFKNGAKLAK